MMSTNRLVAGPGELAGQLLNPSPDSYRLGHRQFLGLLEQQNLTAFEIMPAGEIRLIAAETLLNRQATSYLGQTALVVPRLVEVEPVGQVAAFATPRIYIDPLEHSSL